MTVQLAQPAAIPADLGRSWIDGKSWGEPAGAVRHVNPADGAALSDSESVDARGVGTAVTAARHCFTSAWGQLSLRARQGLLDAFAAGIAAKVDQLAELEALEVGRPLRDAAMLISQAPDLLRRYAGLADRIQGDVVTNEARQFGACWRRPRGVVAAIVPWNFPVMNVLVRLAPALAAGNCVVLKPSEYAPRSAVLLAQIASEAGLPDGTVNVVLGPGDPTGHALAAHPDVDLVTFTGSTRTGLLVARAAAETTLKPVLLECGGKSPQIVLDDAFADDGIWSAIFFSAFWNSGQWCAAKTRLLVPRERLAQAVAGLQAAAAHWRLGDPMRPDTMLGPIVSRAQFDRVGDYFDSARTSGTVVELGCPQGDLDARGLFVTPSIAMDQPREGRLSREEVFGPLLSLEAFDGVDDALNLANQSDYGLMASIWTNRADMGQRFSREVRAGGLTICSSSGAAAQYVPDFVGAYLEPQKQSGMGLDGGAPGLLAYTTSQSITWLN